MLLGTMRGTSDNPHPGPLPKGEGVAVDGRLPEGGTDVPLRAAQEISTAVHLARRFFFLAAIVALAGVSTTAADNSTSPGRRFIAADASKGHVAIIDAAGHVEWEYPVRQLHDLHVLPNGNVLLQSSWTTIEEVTPDKKVVWRYDSATSNGNRGRAVQVHAFQRLPDGLTMIAESGPARILEVDRDGVIHREVPLTVEHPDPHRDTRLVRKLASGNYLACHEADGMVREYDPTGRVVWQYAVGLFGQEPAPGHEGTGNQVFGALRLESGNTLLATGNGHHVVEVTPEGEVVWNVSQHELPGITLQWVTTLEQLPNGNLVIGNCHAGPENPQIIEISRDKKVVWSYRNFEVFGNALTNSQMLDAGGTSLR